MVNPHSEAHRGAHAGWLRAAVLGANDGLVSTASLSEELTALISQSRADLKPALDHLENVVAVLNKNEDNIDNSLRLLAPFYRVFANTLGTGPWFDTFIMNLPPLPGPGGGLDGLPSIPEVGGGH